MIYILENVQIIIKVITAHMKINKVDVENSQEQ